MAVDVIGRVGGGFQVLARRMAKLAGKGVVDFGMAGEAIWHVGVEREGGGFTLFDAAMAGGAGVGGGLQMGGGFGGRGWVDGRGKVGFCVDGSEDEGRNIAEGGVFLVVEAGDGEFSRFRDNGGGVALDACLGGWKVVVGGCG
jgi:hypothetical protein